MTIEVKINRKWVFMSVLDLTPLWFFCILIDREGGAIQVNMDVRDMNYFDARHTMNFEAYNELHARKTVRNDILAGGWGPYRL
ncbi:hypothetical protein CTI12_AA319570 [Artemisia annua]|uniref:Uncharacterized protein n=1 Tax=Artemisia annua TaxID=35608 RepID=A0A2U1N100_ARTAN|nr:hypothetical protein CTI12_AA319570 [Artemisia annua]